MSLIREGALRYAQHEVTHHFLKGGRGNLRSTLVNLQSRCNLAGRKQVITMQESKY